MAWVILFREPFFLPLGLPDWPGWNSLPLRFGFGSSVITFSPGAAAHHRLVWRGRIGPVRCWRGYARPAGSRLRRST